MRYLIRQTHVLPELTPLDRVDRFETWLIVERVGLHLPPFRWSTRKSQATRFSEEDACAWLIKLSEFKDERWGVLPTREAVPCT